MIKYIIGGIMAVGGIFLSFFLPLKYKNKNIEIKYERTTSIGELKEILSGNAAAGLEGYRHFVELKGTAGSEIPVKAPFSKKEVAYFNASLYQVYQERETYKDSTGTHQRLKKNESLLSTQKSSSPILLSDSQSGEKAYIDISHSGIQLDTIRTLDRFEPVNNIRNNNYLKNYHYNNMGIGTLGFRMTEETIPLGQPLYVLGEAVLEGARIILNKPLYVKKPFIVSVRSETDIVHGNKTSGKIALVFGILLILAGIAVIVFMH